MRILFIGNSHTYVNDLPEIFRELAQERGIELEAVMLCHGNFGFEDHAAEPQTRFNILYGHYDYVVLQHRAHPMGDLQAMHQGLETIMQWIRQAGSTPIFYETWTKKGDEAGQPAMSEVYEALGREYHARVAPVGDEWQKARAEHPEWEFYREDNAHAAPAGSKLAARVLLDTIFPEK